MLKETKLIFFLTVTMSLFFFFRLIHLQKAKSTVNLKLFQKNTQNTKNVVLRKHY